MRRAFAVSNSIFIVFNTEVRQNLLSPIFMNFVWHGVHEEDV